MIRYSDLPEYRNSDKIPDRIIAVLLQRGGILPIHEIMRELQKQGILMYGSNSADHKARALLLHHIRRCYSLDRKTGDICALVPAGKGDRRYWSNPFDAPDVTSFTFSLLCKDMDHNHESAIPYIREYMARYENTYGVQCNSGQLLVNSNQFYGIKKEVKYYLNSIK